MQTLWTTRYAQRTQRMRSSAVRELLKLTELPEVISFAGGLPAPDVFPVEKFKEATCNLLSKHGTQALQYGTTEGYSQLRALIARLSSRYGIVVEPDNVLITTGSQQALDLIGKVFINPGDHILVEQPTYLGALQAWNAYQAEFVPVALDEDGVAPEVLESAMRFGPKFVYALPNFQNPSGITWSEERRRKLLEIADHYGVPVLEDDPYGQLRYEGEHIPPLVALDATLQANHGPFTGNVIYLSTFSKTLAPGLRLAWIIAPQEVIQRLVQAKQGADLHTSTLSQMLAFEVLTEAHFLDTHVKQIRAVYGERRNVMLKALQAYFPPGVSWTRPQGGLFLWLTFPDWLDAAELLQEAVREKVAFVPGVSFHADGTGRNTARLNFSYANPERIEEGIRRLGRALERVFAAHSETVA